jgi:hypothetical protein
MTKKGTSTFAVPASKSRAMAGWSSDARNLTLLPEPASQLASQEVRSDKLDGYLLGEGFVGAFC